MGTTLLNPVSEELHGGFGVFLPWGVRREDAVQPGPGVGPVLADCVDKDLVSHAVLTLHRLTSLGECLELFGAWEHPTVLRLHLFQEAKEVLQSGRRLQCGEILVTQDASPLLREMLLRDDERSLLRQREWAVETDLLLVLQVEDRELVVLLAELHRLVRVVEDTDDVEEDLATLGVDPSADLVSLVGLE
jgi:hypothetical protein